MRSFLPSRRLLNSGQSFISNFAARKLAFKVFAAAGSSAGKLHRCGAVADSSHQANRSGRISLMTRWVALPRGVNLGGCKLLMADLATICIDLGYRDPTTLLASGNVVLTTEDGAADVVAAVEAALGLSGLVTDVLVRDAGELERVIAANPFTNAVEDHPSHVTVTFHRDPFPAQALDRLRTVYNGPERLSAVGRELFVDFGGRKVCVNRS